MCGLFEINTSTSDRLIKFKFQEIKQTNQKKKITEKNKYLVECVLKKQSKKLNNWKLRTGFNPPQMNTDEQAQKIGELFQVTAKRERAQILRELLRIRGERLALSCNPRQSHCATRSKSRGTHALSSPRLNAFHSLKCHNSSADVKLLFLKACKETTDVNN